MAESHSNQSQPSGWAMGWATFAAVMMMLGGIWSAIAGISGISKDTIYVLSPDYVLQLDVQAWGWVHLLIGIVLFLSGMGLFSGNVLARTVGVVVAGVSAIANFGWIPYYPVWAIVVIAVDVAIIWALTAHGRDLAS